MGCWRKGSAGLRLTIWVATALALAGAICSGPANAALPVPEYCQVDVQGANDQPGQKDLTQFCVDLGVSPYELNMRWDWDDRVLPGGNTADPCTLYDTDGDGKANLAVCVTTRDGGQPMTLAARRLYTCGDTRPDRCTSSVLVSENKCVGGPNAGQACDDAGDCKTSQGEGNCMPDPGVNNTMCEVAQLSIDPFPAGDDYPIDSASTCVVDLSDFGIRPVPAFIKFIVQILIALLVILWGDLHITFFQETAVGNLIDIPITVLWLTGMTNTMNFFDGIDGLAASMSIISCMFLGIIAFNTDQPALGWFAVALMGACGGFMPHNFRMGKPARVFLGDAGSTFLGFTLAGLAVMGKWSNTSQFVTLTAPVLIFGVLIFDMIYVNLSRLKNGHC